MRTKEYIFMMCNQVGRKGASNKKRKARIRAEVYLKTLSQYIVVLQIYASSL